jgi:hypothetical protein
LLIRPPWPVAATRDKNRGMPGQARLSLVRQSPLLRGRFSFQDEVPGSSPGRPTTHRRRSERCRQRAGSAGCRLGPRWGRTPIPRRHLQWPRRGRPPGRQARRRPPTVVAHPAEDASHAAGAATSRCSLLPRPPQPPRRALRTPAWPAWSLSGQARPPRPAPNPAARVRHRPPTDQRHFGSIARVPASSTVDRAVDGPAATGVSTRSCGHGRPATSTWVPNATRLRWEDTDASGWTGQTPDGWTPHGWTADDWTLDGWTADGRPPDSLDDDPR